MLAERVRAVIFDLDGTLIDAYLPVIRSIHFALSRENFPLPSPGLIKRSVGWGDRHLIEKFVGRESRDRVLAVYRKHHARSLKHGLKFLPGALNILNTLRRQGLNLAVASNRPRKFSLIILKELEILHYFDLVLCADQLKRPKPYPDILLTTLNIFRLRPSEALYVGDMTIDVTTGKRARVRTVAVATGSCSLRQLMEAKPYRVIRQLPQLNGIIQELQNGASSIHKGDNR